MVISNQHSRTVCGVIKKISNAIIIEKPAITIIDEKTLTFKNIGFHVTIHKIKIRQNQIIWKFVYYKLIVIS